MPGEDNEVIDPEFVEFAAAGEVETLSDASEPVEKEPKQRRNPAKEAKVEESADDLENEQETDELEDDSDEEEGEKPKKSAREHQIERLKREKAELNRKLREAERRTEQQLLERLENIEKSLQGPNSGDNQSDEIPAPDPSDAKKYPLGHLDDRYIEDKLDWLAEQKAAQRADAVLQREQENEQQTALRQQQTEKLDKVDSLSVHGSELYDDFQEKVVEAGMKGDWSLSEPTFDAAAEAENGAQILYDLASDKKEAARVAKLSPYQQLKYVAEKDAEIGKGKSPRRIPRAGEPPKNTARGANSRVQINPATENLDDFEKAWEADARKSNR